MASVAEKPFSFQGIDTLTHAEQKRMYVPLLFEQPLSPGEKLARTAERDQAQRAIRHIVSGDITPHDRSHARRQLVYDMVNIFSVPENDTSADERMRAYFRAIKEVGWKTDPEIDDIIIGQAHDTLQRIGLTCRIDAKPTFSLPRDPRTRAGEILPTLQRKIFG